MNRIIHIPGTDVPKAVARAANGTVGRTLTASDGQQYEMYDLLGLVAAPDGGLWVLVACDPLSAQPPVPVETAPATEQERAWATLGHGLAPEPEPGPPVAIPHSEPPAGLPQVAYESSILLTDKQLKAIYAIGRAAHRLTEEEVNARALAKFGKRVSDLTKLQASQLIDALKAAVAV